MLRSWPRLVVSLLPLLLSCGTDAIGADACREIEFARCEAAIHCGLVEDVATCQGFFQDHCLHGVQLEATPRKVEVGRCVKVLEVAGECADRNGARSSLETCDQRVLDDSDARNVCEIVVAPELAEDCAFLDPDPEPEPEPEPEPAPETASDGGTPDGG
jgi:hypothetical protein